MPNHCENTLVVRGKHLTRFIKQAEGPNVHGEMVELTFHAFIPYPEKYAALDRGMQQFWEAVRTRCKDLGRELTPAEVQEIRDQMNFYHERDGFNSGGYEWRVNHWGTKWDAYDVERTVEGDKVTYYFDTAWAPPLGAVAAMAAQYPSLSFTLEYIEPGMGFAGKDVYEHGDLLTSEEWEINDEEEVNHS